MNSKGEIHIFTPVPAPVSKVPVLKPFLTLHFYFLGCFMNYRSFDIKTNLYFDLKIIWFDKNLINIIFLGVDAKTRRNYYISR